jgi:hypothetical protein
MTLVSDQEFETLLKTAKSGIGRFFDEGHYVWTKKSFLDLFHNKIELGDPRLKNAFNEWEKIGSVKFHGQDDRYIEIVRPMD